MQQRRGNAQQDELLQVSYATLGGGRRNKQITGKVPLIA